MAKNKPASGATAPFAHLLSLVTGASKGKRAADERDDEQMEDEEKDADAETDEDEEKAEDEGSEEKAESEEDEEKAEDDNEDVDAEDEDEKKEAKAHAAGFAAAQARGRKIFGAASAAVRPDMAAHLAFNDRMSADRAIAMLDMAAGGTAAEPGPRLHRRMSRVQVPNPGAGGPSGKRAGKNDVDDFVAQAAAAAKKAGIA